MSRPERGAYGNKRGKEAQKRRATNRQNDPRYQSAMEDVRKQQEALESLIAQQKEEPAVGEVQGALYAAQKKKAEEELQAAEVARANLKICEECGQDLGDDHTCPTDEIEVAPVAAKTNTPVKFSIKKLKKVSEPKFETAGMTARLMLKAGYHVHHVIETTGMGWEDLDDLPLDEDGFGMTKARIEKEAEEEEE